MRNVIGEPMRVLFMGTPEFAVPSLRALVEHAAPARLWASGLDMIGVVTRPDKPAGRGRHTVISPVKQFALESGLPVYQPGPLRRPEAQALLRSLTPDVIIVAAFGQLLPTEILELPRHCCLNVHASLLPKYRGASPIAAAIAASDAQTGVTIMLMEEGLDTGPMLTQQAVPIAPDDTTGTLTPRLADLGAALLVEALPRWLAGGIAPQPQDDTRATMTRPLRKEDGHLDWSKPAEQLARLIRSANPWPGAFTEWNGHQVKILQAHVVDNASLEQTPGTCALVGDTPTSRQLVCACGQGALGLDVIQLEGKRALPTADVLRGHPALASARFGAS